MERRPRKPVPIAPYLDPRIGEWCFDSSTLINAHAADPFLLRLMAGFTGRAHLLAEVLDDEVHGAAGLTIHIPGWCKREELVLREDLTLYAELHRRFGPDPTKNRGEAACIVAARRNGWRLVLDERVGYQAAVEHGVTVTRTPQLLVSTVRAGWWTADEAWAAYMNLRRTLAERGEFPRFGPIWNGHDEFVALCAARGFDEPLTAGA